MITYKFNLQFQTVMENEHRLMREAERLREKEERKKDSGFFSGNDSDKENHSP